MKGIYRKALQLLSTLKGFVFTATVGVAMLTFLGATLASSLLYERLLEERSLETSKEISLHNFNDVYQALRVGGSRQQLDDVNSASKSAFPITLDQVSIYPGKAVEALYGRAPQLQPFNEVEQVLNGGKQSVAKVGRHIRYVFPAIAQPDCLRCHTNAKDGEVLGAIVVRHNLKTVTTAVRIYYVELFLGLGLLVLLVAATVSVFAARKIKRSVDLLSNVRVKTTGFSR